MLDPAITYLTAVLASAVFVLTVRFAFSRIPQIARMRDMLSAAPSVRLPAGIHDVIFREAVAVIETMLISVVFVLVRWSVPFDGVPRGLVFAAAVVIVETLPRAAACALDTSYPRTLLLHTVLRDIAARFAMGLALGAIIEG